MFWLPDPPTEEVGKLPAEVSGRFASVLGAHPCELLGAFWPREGLCGALPALQHQES